VIRRRKDVGERGDELQMPVDGGDVSHRGGAEEDEPHAVVGQDLAGVSDVGMTDGQPGEVIAEDVGGEAGAQAATGEIDGEQPFDAGGQQCRDMAQRAAARKVGDRRQRAVRGARRTEGAHFGRPRQAFLFGQDLHADRAGLWVSGSWSGVVVGFEPGGVGSGE
jgi:hypothetical protein